MQQPIHLMVAHVTECPTSLVIASPNLHLQISTGTFENLDHFILPKDYSATYEAELNTALSKAIYAKHEKVHNLDETVPHRLSHSSRVTIDEHILQKQDYTAQL